MSSRDNQEQAPIYDALIAYQYQLNIGLHTPGHKGHWMPKGLDRLLTPFGLRCDLPSMEATDYYYNPRTCIREAQRLAASLYGAAETFYLVNGSTIGVQAMMLAALRPGDKILISRYSHLSAFAGLVLSGATPIYFQCRWSETAGPVPEAEVEIDALLREHKNVRALFLTRPTYYGVGRTLEGLAAICLRHGVALLVDEAHGAHLGFLAGENLPSALALGADLVVQSVHKTVGSLVGTAQLHRGRHSRIQSEQVRAALNLLQSTSPNYLLLASLDLTRREMFQNGRDLFQTSAERCANLTRMLRDIPGIRPLRMADTKCLAGCLSDPLRLVVDVTGLGLTGHEAEKWIQEGFQMSCEFSDSRNIVFVFTHADSACIYSALECAFDELAKKSATQLVNTDIVMNTMLTPPMALNPREAAFRPRRRVSLRHATDSICGEYIATYPPGIPQVCPGERLVPEVLSLLEACRVRGGDMLCSDPSLQSIVVLD